MNGHVWPEPDANVAKDPSSDGALLDTALHISYIASRIGCSDFTPYFIAAAALHLIRPARI